LAGATLTSPEGSAVLPKSRFFRYVLRLFNATPNPRDQGRLRGKTGTKTHTSR
jgi:hypothetical protein